VTERNYWLLFGAVQIVGLIAPRFANVHTNPFPAILGLALLLPGCLVGFIFDLSDREALTMAVPINAAAWYLLRRILMRVRA